MDGIGACSSTHNVTRFDPSAVDAGAVEGSAVVVAAWAAALAAGATIKQI